MKKPLAATKLIESFDFEPGRVLARKYEIVSRLGAGWEGEVYKIRELGTGIERAAKFYFPHHNPKNRASTFYARKLHKLRHCPIIIKYITQEMITYRRTPITCVVSEYVDSEPLSDYLMRQRGQRLSAFQGLHLLYALVLGVDQIHQSREYHGDLHSKNVLVRQYGLGYEIKLLDMFHWGPATLENIHTDVLDLIRLFYDVIGGAKHYSKHSAEIKAICCGLKRSLILRKFKTAGQLRTYLETMEWS